MEEYLDVTMLTNLSWVALGHKPEDSSFGMVCKNAFLKIRIFDKKFHNSCKTKLVSLIWALL